MQSPQATIVTPFRSERGPSRVRPEPEESPKDNRFWYGWDGLQKYNFVLFIVHIILAVIFIIYFRRVLDPAKPVSSINLSLYDHVFKSDMTNPTGPLKVISEVAADVSESTIGNLIVSFFAITAAFHLFYALNPRGVYLNAVLRGNNYFRWIEYSITATIMLFIIAILSGVKDIKSYFALLASAVAMIATGQWFETTKGMARWLPILVGFILLMAAFLTIWTSFRDRLNDVNAAGIKLPTWLWATIIVLFIFYASFGFVPIAQIIFPGLNYRNAEKVYLTLSLTSKATLGMLVAYGFGQRAQSSTSS